MKKSVLPLLTSSLAHLCAKPHPYHSVNNPSRRNARSLAMQQLFPRVVAIFAFLFFALEVQAQVYYVFKNDNTTSLGFLYNNNGALRNTTTFSPACVWTANEELKTSNSESDGRTLTSYSDDSRYLYTSGRTRPNNASVSATSFRYWFVANSYLCTWNVANNYNYLSRTAENTYKTGDFPSNRFQVIKIDVNTFEGLTIPDISGNNTISAKGTETYNAESEYQPKYTNYYFDNTNHYFNASGTSITTPPTPVTTGITYAWNLEGIDGKYAIVNGSTGVVTYKELVEVPSVTATLKCTATHTASGTTETATYIITFKNPNILEKPAISYANASTANKVIVTLSSSENDVDIYYTTDGSTAPSSSSGTKYTGPFEVTSGTTIKAIAVRGTTVSSAIVSQKVEYIQQGVSGGTVTLDDYEDHNWTYYKGVDTSVDGGNYNTNYLGKMYSPDPRNVKITYDGNGGSVSSSETETSFVYYETIEKEQPGETDYYAYTVIPNPFSKRPNGKGFGGWKIISGAGETVGSGNIAGHKNGDVLSLDEKIHFINLDNDYTANCTSATIELQATWVNATIQTITSNPGSNQTYTFTGGTYETNFIVLKNVNYTRTMTISSPCTIMMVEPDGSADYRNSYTFTGNITVNNTGGTKIEYAAWAPNGNINANGKSLTIGRGVTTTGQTGRTIQGVTDTGVTVDQVVRVESGTYGEVQHYYGSASSKANSTVPNKVVRQVVVWGCDYDRAKNDNDKLTITGDCQYTYGSFITSNPEQWGTLTYIKSGKFHPKGNQSNDAWFDDGSSNVYYMGRYASEPKTNLGRRYLEIQGGELCNIAGGSVSAEGKEDIVSFALRVKGGLLHGLIYGCARTNNSSGSRCFVLTGGTLEGWVSPGTNGAEPHGTDNNTGVLNGYGYIYVGGNTRIDSKGNQYMFNKSLGGNVFGAGSGRDSESTRVSGSNTKGTNVVIADNSYVERGVYGGGSFGYCTETANIYITGGVVDGKPGGVKVTNLTNKSYDASIQGGVYGGSCQNKGNHANIFMTGGLVKTGIYGGSNAYGTLAGNVKMVIVGGQVGKDADNTANIHGGGYGASTKVSGNVEVTLGQLGKKGATLYGNVYGGSALGQVNTNTSNHTWVTMNSGTIHGSIFGGGMGELKSGYSSTSAKPYYVANEGIVNGAIKVVVNGTDPTILSGTNNEVKTYAVDAVFGGCDLVAYAGTPIVEIHNCESSIAYVYGGGNASDVQHTDVTVWGGNINYVFGGGNGEDTSKPGADIVGNTASDNKGNTNVKIYGGTINYIFGGSNLRGNVSGTASVLLDEQAETGKSQCPILVQEAYGGANKAPMDGTPMLSIGCLSGRLENVYGGSKAVDVNSDIVLYITSGQFGKVFGGNNESGAVNGSITVNIDETGCHPIIIDELYAGGNLAPYTTPSGKAEPTVNVISCSHIGQVFGGGYGATAIVTGNPIVNINQIAGKYDPDDTDETNGWTDNPGTKLGIIGEVFGGGNAAKIVGDTHVNIGTLTTNKHLTTGATDTKCGANISGNVYGGGNAADVTGKTHVQVGPKPTAPTTN